MLWSLRFLLYCLALSSGVLLLIALAWPQYGLAAAQVFVDALKTWHGQLVLGGLGALLILLPWAILNRWYLTKRFAKEVSYQTELGKVAVSLQAIEEALTRAVEAEHSVRKVALRVYQDRVRRQVVIEAALTLWDDGDVTTINWHCQEIIRTRFSELMPDQTGFQIQLTVHRLTKRQPAAPAPAPEEPPAEEDQPVEQPAAKESDHVPLPGLTATQGGTDNQAGAALLARRKATTTDESAGIESSDSAGANDADDVATEVDHDAIDEVDDVEDAPDPLQNLYVGPQYSVDDSTDDHR